MTCAGFLGLCLLPPDKLRRDDGSFVAVNPPRTAWEEFKSNLLVFTDWKLLLMIPAFLPAEGFLVYSGSVNGKFSLLHAVWKIAYVSEVFHNDLRARSLLSFMAVVLQVPCGWALQQVLDRKAWGRRKRGLVGLTVVAIPLVGAWTWELVSY